jgi:hypothetical protein
MIGTIFNDPSDVGTWRVVAADGPYWIVERVDDFRPVERLTAADLASRFGTSEESPTQPSEDDGWRALSDANDRAALRLARGDVPAAPTPEERITAAEAARLGHRR